MSLKFEDFKKTKEGKEWLESFEDNRIFCLDDLEELEVTEDGVYTFGTQVHYHGEEATKIDFAIFESKGKLCVEYESMDLIGPMDSETEKKCFSNLEKFIKYLYKNFGP